MIGFFVCRVLADLSPTELITIIGVGKSRSFDKDINRVIHFSTYKLMGIRLNGMVYGVATIV